MVVGTLINPDRYYWAVIAAFVAFTGTGSRFETFRKSSNRVLGTLAGLVAGIGLATLTSGDVLWSLAVIVAAIFCGFYLVRVSYAYMIFFVTIMVSQLYGILGEFSDELLLIRLAETAAGGAVGVVVALLVTPVSTRDTVAHAERGVVDALRDLLSSAARQAADPSGVRAVELDARLLAVDAEVRKLRLAAAPLVRYPLWESRPRDVRHRLAVVAACVDEARATAVAARDETRPEPGLAAALDRLAAVTRGCGPAGVGWDGDAAWVARLQRLDDLLCELARLDPGRGGAPAPSPSPSPAPTPVPTPGPAPLVPSADSDRQARLDSLN
jgi:hypothetical protein